MLHCMSGRWWRRGGGAALGRGGARAPASPALTTLSGPRPPSRLGPVPSPRPVRPRCPLGRLKPVGQAAGGKFARLRQRRLCEGRGKRGAVHSGAWGAICLGELTGLGGPICLQGYLSWRRVWEDLRVGVPTLKGSPDLGSGPVRTHVWNPSRYWGYGVWSYGSGDTGRWVSHLSVGGGIWGFLCLCIIVSKDY